LGGGGGGLGDDALADLAGDAAGDADAGADAEAEPGPLLAEPEAPAAEPGQRDDSSRKDGCHHGAMNRHMQSIAGIYGRGGSKQLFNGGTELGMLARGRMTTGESQQNDEDKILTETQVEIKKLIAQLEQKHENKT